MVNYHDPIVLQQDICAFPFVAKYIDSGSQLTSFDSGRVGFLACCGWTLLVCLPRSTLITYLNNKDRYNPVIIFSWEFVTTLDYEWSVIRGHRPFRWTIWVSINAHSTVSVEFRCPGPGAKLVWQIYTLTRIFTLITIILTLVGLDATARYNCEVRGFYICFIGGCDLIGHDPKVRIVFELVSKFLLCTWSRST